jgi:hypothetical protein
MSLAKIEPRWGENTPQHKPLRLNPIDIVLLDHMLTCSNFYLSHYMIDDIHQHVKFEYHRGKGN